MGRVVQPNKYEESSILEAMNKYGRVGHCNIFQEADAFCESAMKRIPLVIKKKAETAKPTVMALADFIEAHLVEEA